VLTPDGRTVVWCDHDWGISGYRAADGEKLYHFEAPADPTYAVATSSKFLGVGDFRLVSPYRIWNLETGKEMASFATDATVRRAVFSPKADSLYVATTNNVLRKYRVNDGKLLSEIKTQLAPVAVGPDDDLCVGFITDSERAGRMVLAHLHDGQTLEVLNPDAFLLNNAAFASDGNTVAFNSDSDVCKIMKSPDLADSVRRLEHAALDPALAAASADLIDYREQLASRQELSAVQLESRSLASALTAYASALRIREQLAEDFPRIDKLQEAVGDSLENLANKTPQDEAEDAYQLLTRLAAIRKRLAEAHPDDKSLGDKSKRALALLLEARKRQQKNVHAGGLRTPDSHRPLNDGGAYLKELKAISEKP
jgi:hypothetical protein